LSFSHKDIATTDKDREKWLRILRTNSTRRTYRGIMIPILRWLDKRLSAPEIAANRGPIVRAWSGGLLTFTMVFALAYPILATTAQWIFGSAIVFNGVEIVPTGDAIALTYLCVWLAIAIFLMILSYLKPQWRSPSLIVATVVLFAGLYFSARFGVPAALAIALAVALAGALALAGAFAFALAVAVAVALAVAVAGAFAGAFALAVAGAVAGAGAFALAGALAEIPERISKRFIGPIPQIGQLLIYFVALLIAVRFYWNPADGDALRAIYTMLFLGFLPLINAFFDFLSWGLTRHFIRAGLVKHAIWQFGLDFALAVLTFVALGCSLILFFGWLTLPDGTLFLDVGTIFDQLTANPQDMWWLAVILGTTLLPTLIHMGVAICVVAISWPRPLRTWLANLLIDGQTSPVAASKSGLAISALMIFPAWWVAMCGYWLIFTLNHGVVINSVIAVFRWFANAIGVI
jgi:hypothetical protein